jgi:hypothetical protein
VFYIGFVSGPRVDAEGWPHAEGELTLGEYAERFESDLRFWSVAEYEGQWRDAVLRLVGGAPSSALVTSYRGPGAGVHFVWSLWRDGDTVHVQETPVPTESLSAPFDPARAWDYVGPRHTVTEDGATIPEWAVALAQLATFVLDR